MIFTSNFASSHKFPATVKMVSIAIGPPNWYKGSCELRLAPTRPMLKMSAAEYRPAFDRLLAALDPKQIYDELPTDAVLLCWESAGTFCHRRRVAEWLEASLGITVPELGFPRDAIGPYDTLPDKGSPEGKRAIIQLRKKAIWSKVATNPSATYSEPSLF